MIGWRFYDPGSSPLREVLEQVAAGQRRRAGGGEPMPINVFEEPGMVVVEAALPGVVPEAVEVSCSENVLIISARAEVLEREYLHQEMLPVQYLRHVALPGDCRFDAAEASVELGVLTVRVPKIRPQAPERIRIRVNRRGSAATAIDADYAEVKPKKPGRRSSGSGSSPGPARSR